MLMGTQPSYVEVPSNTNFMNLLNELNGCFPSVRWLLLPPLSNRGLIQGKLSRADWLARIQHTFPNLRVCHQPTSSSRHDIGAARVMTSRLPLLSELKYFAASSPLGGFEGAAAALRNIGDLVYVCNGCLETSLPTLVCQHLLRAIVLGNMDPPPTFPPVFED
jgi:hypothetical protein